MLKIVIPASDIWDEKNECFESIKETTLRLEHSLVSISKWESKWHKSFLHTKDKTDEQLYDYIRCMMIDPNADPKVVRFLTGANIKAINEYIEDPMTATTFREEQKKTFNREVVTSELIYYWMITAGIPVEFEKWHLNRLITLIRVCGVKNAPPKKSSSRDLANKYARINAANRKRLNTRG